MDMAILVLWLICGLAVLMTNQPISKLSYALVWIVLILALIRNML